MRNRVFAELKSLGEISEIRSGYSFRSKVKPEPDGAHLVVQMKDINESNRLVLDRAVRAIIPQLNRIHLLQPGDLVFRSRGVSYGAALVPDSIEPAVLAAPLLRLRPVDVLPEYLRWFLNSPATLARLGALARGTAVQMITTDSLKSIKVPVPSLERQKLIAEAAALAETEQALISRIAARRAQRNQFILNQQALKAES